MDIQRIVKGSRTYTYNAFMTALNGGFITFLINVDWQTAGFTPQQAIWVLIGLQMVDRVMGPLLRKVTTGPVGGGE